ncbi:MAG: PIN domain-containing protein [Nitrospirota bacterium]|nr:PIN domain-containing protein [Nitrospirota bacterium]MDH5588243.1 PIN domain-containing protein [Nitrospirota bacterium]
MIAVDTNILVYAHREDSPWHESAYQQLTDLAEGTTPWAIPWPCLHEFLAIVTHPRIYNPPTPLQTACDQVDAWLESPRVLLLAETTGYWPVLQHTTLEGKIQGPSIHDARIAALCQHHGIQELWTADRDFSRFPTLTPRNPLLR